MPNSMIIVPDILEYISSTGKSIDLEKNNIGKCLKEYTRFLDRLRLEYGALGMMCQNTIEASLVGSLVDCMIFPTSVLESQIHREIASDFGGKILLQLNRSINDKIVLNFMESVSVRHCFIGVDKLGCLCRKISPGNQNIGVLIEKHDSLFLNLDKYKNVYIKREIYKKEEINKSTNSFEPGLRHLVEKYERLL